MVDITPQAPRPFTPDTLADHWGCSSDHVRELCRTGQLTHFRLGKKMFRIPPSAVAEFEGKQCNTALAGTEESGPSSGLRADARAVARSVRQTASMHRPHSKTGLPGNS